MRKKLKKNAQNLIEFVFVFPLVVMLVLAIFELAMFYRTVHSVQNVALQAAANASTQIVTSDMTSTIIGDPKFNVAAQRALDVVIAKEGALNSSKTSSFTVTTDANFGSPPYTLYEFKGNQTSETGKPLVTLRVDYSNPMQNGIKTQLIYQYSTIIFAAAVPLPNGDTMTIIPRNIEISSTKIQQSNQL
jgi:Flp pilus assembly protein TadG